MTKWKPTDYEVITHGDGSVTVKRSDGANIPTDERNRDYYEFLQVEAADKEGLITRTTIEEPEPQPSEMDLLKARIATLESDMDTVKTGVTDLQDARTIEK